MSARKEKVRVAVAGCGRFSEPGHLFYYRLHPDAELVAVCDVREEAARAMASRYGAKQFYTDYLTMLDESRPDAVSVCVPTYLHPEMVIEAAKRGIHVLCEKPMAPSVADGQRMVDACREAGVALHVGYHKRYDRGLIRVREMLHNQEYGRCFHSELTWRGLSTFGNVPIVNRAFEIASALGLSTEGFSPGWRFNDPRCPGGVFEVICHLLDLAVWFFGPPKRVQGELRTVTEQSSRPDHAAVLLTGELDEVVYVTMSHKALALKEEDVGLFRCEGGNISYRTDSTRLSLLPAHITVETDKGLFGRRRNIHVPPIASLATMPHYHKINNFLLAIRGELPESEETIVCTGESAMEVDRIVEKLLTINP